MIYLILWMVNKTIGGNNMKKIILILLLLLMVGISTTYAYVVSQLKTNDQLIKIGNPDASGATLTPLYASDDVLIPKTVIASKDNEKYQFQWTLTVDSDTNMEFTLDTELPKEFKISTDRPDGVYVYNTNTTYTITLELLELVDYSEFTFYLYVKF